MDPTAKKDVVHVKHDPYPVLSEDGAHIPGTVVDPNVTIDGVPATDDTEPTEAEGKKALDPVTELTDEKLAISLRKGDPDLHEAAASNEYRAAVITLIADESRRPEGSLFLINHLALAAGTIISILDILEVRITLPAIDRGASAVLTPELPNLAVEKITLSRRSNCAGINPPNHLHNRSAVYCLVIDNRTCPDVLNVTGAVAPCSTLTLTFLEN